MKHTLAWIDPAKQTVTIDYRPVHTYTMSNEVSYIEQGAGVLSPKDASAREAKITA